MDAIRKLQKAVYLMAIGDLQAYLAMRERGKNPLRANTPDENCRTGGGCSEVAVWARAQPGLCLFALPLYIAPIALPSLVRFSVTGRGNGCLSCWKLPVSASAVLEDRSRPHKEILRELLLGFDDL
jgi:hypothetical protein